MYLRLTKAVVILCRLVSLDLSLYAFGDTFVETFVFVCQGCSAPFITRHGFHNTSTACRIVFADLAQVGLFVAATFTSFSVAVFVKKF